MRRLVRPSGTYQVASSGGLGARAGLRVRTGSEKCQCNRNRECEDPDDRESDLSVRNTTTETLSIRASVICATTA